MTGNVAIIADDLTGALDTAVAFARPHVPIAIVRQAAALPATGSFAYDSETRDAPLVEVREQVHRHLPEVLKRSLHYKKIADTRGIGCGESIASGGVFVCDAECDGDLLAITRSAPELDKPVLWCGSAGLARALGGPAAPVALPEERPALVVTTSRHPVASAQFARLKSAVPSAVIEISARDPAAIGAHAQRLTDGAPLALRFNLSQMDSDSAEIFFRTAFEQLVSTYRQPRFLVVVGGDTLMLLVRALGATQLDALGEWQPGMPLSIMSDGRWRGTFVLSKSGASGDEWTFLDILGVSKEQL